MTEYYSVFSAASQLSQQDRLRLIDALWDTIPSEIDAPFSEEWSREIQRRVAEYQSGQVQIVPWEPVRDETLTRVHRL